MLVCDLCVIPKFIVLVFIFFCFYGIKNYFLSLHLMHKQDKKHKIMLGLKHSVYVVWNRMDYFLYGSSGFTAVGLIMLYAEILFHLLF